MKNPGLAAIMSFFIISLGQFYNGQIGKGIIFIVLTGISALLCTVAIGFVLLPIVWLFGIWDAYKTAEKLNQTGSDVVA